MLKLALTGKPKSGKTTTVLMLVDALIKNGIKVGGFYTTEVKKNDRRLGFEIVDILTGKHGVLAGVDQESKIKVGKYGVNVGDLEGIGVRALEHGFENCQVHIVDEVGPMELKSELFRKVVRKVLNSDKLTIFTVHYRSSDDLVREVKRKSNLFELTSDNREKIVSTLIGELMAAFDTN